MAHMPTTRFGRYRFYRERALRRARKARKVSTIGFSDGSPGNGGAPTRRQRVIAGFPKQIPRSFPLHPNHGWAFGGFGVTIQRFHSRFRFDQALLPEFVHDRYPAWYHPSEQLTNCYFRRVKRLPRLAHIPVVGYRHGLGELESADFFPFDFYPSGAPSYRSQHFP